MTISANIFYMTIYSVILLDNYMFSIIFYMNICHVILLDDYVFYNILYDYILCHFAR